MQKKWKELAKGTDLYRLNESLNARALDVLIECFPTEVQYCRDPTTAANVRFSFVHRLAAKLLEVQKEDDTQLLDATQLLDFMKRWRYDASVSLDELRDVNSYSYANFFAQPELKLWSERREKAAKKVREQERY